LLSDGRDAVATLGRHFFPFIDEGVDYEVRRGSRKWLNMRQHQVETL